jgi:hypothetical protein
MGCGVCAAGVDRVLPEDGHRSGPKHVVVVHNKIEHEKHLLRTVVLIKVLVQ